MDRVGKPRRRGAFGVCLASSLGSADGSRIVLLLCVMASPPCRPGAARLKHALLFRGETFRFGCNAKGVRIQDDIMRSQREMIADSILACGASIDVLLLDDLRGCANASLRASLSSGWRAINVQQSQVRGISTQAQGVRAALDLFLPLARSYDSLILSRYDLRIFRPFREWGCVDNQRIGISSRCGQQQWKHWRCSGDMLFVVPRAHLLAFNASVGNAQGAVAASGCFSPSKQKQEKAILPRSVMEGREKMSMSGHGCFNVLARRIGEESLSFCWPGESEGGGEWAVGGPDARSAIPG